MTFLSGMRLTPARLNPVYAHLRQTTVQTLANSSWADIVLQAEDLDSHGGHSTTTNTARFTCPAGFGGVYELAGGVAFAANASGQRWCRWAKNGSELPGSGSNINATASGQALLDARTIQVTLVPGDYVTLQGFQSSGGNLDTYVGVGYAQSSMMVRRVVAS